MKTSQIKLAFLVSLIFIICLAASCKSPIHFTSKTLPPGKEKKLIGRQSAKPFAPGQQKK